MPESSENKIKSFLNQKKKFIPYAKDLENIELFKQNYIKQNPDSTFLEDKDIPLSSGLTNRGLYINKLGVPTQVGQFNVKPVDRPSLSLDKLNPLSPTPNIPERQPVVQNLQPVKDTTSTIPFNKFTTGQYGNPNAPYGEYIDEGQRVNVTKNEAQQMGFLRSKGGKLRKFYAGGGNLQPIESSLTPMTEGTTDLVLSPELQGKVNQANNTQTVPNQNKDFSLGEFNPTTANNTQMTGNRMLDQANAGIERDKALRKNIVGAVGSASKLLDLVVPGLGTGVSTGINAVNSFAQGGKMITEIPKSAGTHEQNPNEGVNINNYDSSVEGNETIDNKNKFVFSDRLTPFGSKRSYASLTKPLNKKLELRPDDKITKDYVQMEMDKLAEDQEAQKQYMDILDQAKMLYGGMMKNHKKAFGGGLKIPAAPKDTTINNNPYIQLPTGKNLPVYNQGQISNIQDINKNNTLTPYGYDSVNLNTPVVPSNFTGKLPVQAPNPVSLFPDVFQKKAKGGFFKKLFKKTNPNQAEIDKYKLEHPEELDQNGEFKTVEDASVINKSQKRSDPNYLESIKFNPNIEQDSNIEDLGGSDYRRPVGSTQPMNTIGSYGTNNNQIKQAPNLLPLPQEQGLTKPTSSKGTKSFAGYSQLLGPASQMLTSLTQRNNDLNNLNYRTPEFTPVDEFYASQLAKQTQDQQSAQMSNAIRGTANDQGSYLAAMLAANSGLLSAGSQPANLAYQANVANTAGRNQNAQIKAGIQNQNIDEREKLLDNGRTQFTNSLYNAGVPITGIDRDNRQSDQFAKTNDIFLKNMQTGDYTFDKDGNIIPKRKMGGKMRKYKSC